MFVVFFFHYTATPEIDPYRHTLSPRVALPISRRFEGALNIPITETLAVRLAGSLVRRDGYTRSVTTGQKLDDQHKDSYRVSVRWTPTDNIENRDRKSTRLNSSHSCASRMPSYA